MNVLGPVAAALGTADDDAGVVVVVVVTEKKVWLSTVYVTFQGEDGGSDTASGGWARNTTRESI